LNEVKKKKSFVVSNLFKMRCKCKFDCKHFLNSSFILNFINPKTMQYQETMNKYSLD